MLSGNYLRQYVSVGPGQLPLSLPLLGGADIKDSTQHKRNEIDWTRSSGSEEEPFELCFGLNFYWHFSLCTSVRAYEGGAMREVRRWAVSRYAIGLDISVFISITIIDLFATIKISTPCIAIWPRIRAFRRSQRCALSRFGRCLMVT